MGGRGGGAYLKNRDQIINIGMIYIGYASSQDTQGSVSNLWFILKTQLGTTFNGTGNFRE